MCTATAPPNLKEQVGHIKDTRVKAAFLALNKDPVTGEWDPNLHPKAKETPSNFPHSPDAKAHRLTRGELLDFLAAYCKNEELVKAVRMKDHQWKTLSRETANMLANKGKAEQKPKVTSLGSGSSVVKGAGDTGAGSKIKLDNSLVKTTKAPSGAGVQVKAGQSVSSWAGASTGANRAAAEGAAGPTVKSAAAKA
ncbi:hypothetical protein Rhopal_005990-T1 [Rhodotorula paludigena]|uniref:Uncharacterized protein n=1 Tax=Rhodotorula paludigena TaxID=86838 RepID=A0AAV5GKU5_9BASI|nr:hypothetical protein Rhopal_005990-T1 [Rhodotorula paludigena]